MHGSLTLTLMDSATNLWALSGVIGRSDGAAMAIIGGTKALTAVLDRIQFTSINGIDTFDAGSISIYYTY